MDRQDADFCIAALQEVLQEYELELNTLKTHVSELPEHIQDPEVAQLRNYDLTNTPILNKLLNYYDLAFDCYRRHPKGTLKYAIKRLPTEDFYDDTIIDFMVQCMLLEPGVIEAVFIWLTKSECIDRIDKSKFIGCLSYIIKQHSILGHSSEVAWAIWGFLLLDKKIPKEAANEIVKMNDSTVLLLALDAKEKGLLDHPELTDHVKKFMTSESLYGPQWLLAYEAVNQKWVPASQRRHVADDPFFSYLKKKEIRFYNNQDIDDYIEVMKDWQPYNPYLPDDITASDEDNDSLPF